MGNHYRRQIKFNRLSHQSKFAISNQSCLSFRYPRLCSFWKLGTVYTLLSLSVTHHRKRYPPLVIPQASNFNVRRGPSHSCYLCFNTSSTSLFFAWIEFAFFPNGKITAVSRTSPTTNNNMATANSSVHFILARNYFLVHSFKTAKCS